MARKKLRSIVEDIPIKVEMNVVNPITDQVVTPEQLEQQIEEARKGKAKVDSKYVGNGDGLQHLFEYKYDYPRFLDSMLYIIKKNKNGTG